MDRLWPLESITHNALRKKMHHEPVTGNHRLQQLEAVTGRDFAAGDGLRGIYRRPLPSLTVFLICFIL